MSIATCCDDLKTGFMTYRLAFFTLAAVCFTSTMLSCSKQDAALVKSTSAEELKAWMSANVSQQTWADANYFYWEVEEVKLNNQTVTSNGIGFMHNAPTNMYPMLEQTSGGYLRTIEIGNPSPVSCANYREIFATTNLFITTRSGKAFTWMHCPVKISEHESNPVHINWQSSVPPSIVLFCKSPSSTGK